MFLNVSKNLALFLQDLASQARCYIGKSFNKCQTITLVKAFYFGKSILFWLKKKSTPFSPFRVRISTPFSQYTFFTGPLVVVASSTKRHVLLSCNFITRYTAGLPACLLQLQYYCSTWYVFFRGSLLVVPLRIFSLGSFIPVTVVYYYL